MSEARVRELVSAGRVREGLLLTLQVSTPHTTSLIGLPGEWGFKKTKKKHFLINNFCNLLHFGIYYHLKYHLT